MNEQVESKSKSSVVANMDQFTGELPDLSKATAAPLPINGEYWSPKEAGEKKRVFFKEIRIDKVVDQKSGNLIDLPVAYFVEVVDGRKQIIRQGGARLTSVFESFVEAGTIIPGMAFEIVYLGLSRTTNGNNIAKWSITPLATK